MSKRVKVGDIVEVNGLLRIVTMVGNGFYQSEPYEEPEVMNKPETEAIVVKAKKGKGKKDDNLV